MNNSRTFALQFAHEHRQRFLEELREFLTISSISNDPEHREDIQRAAKWVAKQLQDLGFAKVQIMPTNGHPVVYGEHFTATPSAPTVLIYGHYDVQPVDPLELWQSDPFDPQVRGENLYARGATDMKGQIMVCLKALEAIRSAGGIPINIKCLIEGEEEVGSPSLEGFIEENKELLSCSVVLNPDAGTISSELPTITYALRGLAYFEIRVYGPDHDLHSGVFGGVVHNPAQALCELIAGMHDHQGRVTLPGFYDKVRLLNEEERQELARLPMDENFYLKNTGAPALWGEAGYSPIERVGTRPTLEINGLLSGFTGQGSKTVIPAWAMAKISCRLVPDQTPEEVHHQLQAYMEQHAPKTIRYEIIPMAGGLPSISDRHSAGIKAMAAAMESVWGIPPAFKPEGGSVPVVATFQQKLGVETINCGFALPEDNLHSPNEKLHLPTWYRGIDTFIHFFYNLSETPIQDE